MTLSSPPFGALGAYLDLYPDGQRFVVAAAPEAAAVPQRDSVVVEFNFFEELKRRVPSGQ